MKKVLAVIAGIFFIVVIAGYLMVSHYKDMYFTGENAEENFQKAMNTAWEKMTDGKFKENIITNEKEVCKYLYDYVSEQKEYKSKSGKYTRNLSDLNLPVEMIAAQMNNIGGEGFKDGFYGYRFAHVKMNGTTHMNYNNDFVLCAVPVLYQVTGIHSYAIGPKGIVLKKDTTGMPVYNATEFGTGWEIYQ